MNLMLYNEIHSDATLPDFGEAFLEHMRTKRHPQVYAASLCAWCLLAEGLARLGLKSLPNVVFSACGKPYFADSPLRFSLSHSGNMAAVILSDGSCGIDIQQIRPEIAEKLYHRVLCREEQRENRDFFEVWTKKEALAKLTGEGLPAKPCEMDASVISSMRIFQKVITDSQGNEYYLTALSEDHSEMQKPDC